VAAHHGLVKMIPQWERGGRVPRERYRLLYLKIFQGALGDLSRGMELSLDVILQVAEVRARAALLPGAGEVNALGASALAKPRSTMTAAEIRALTAETISRLHEVAANLARLSALLGDDEPGETGKADETGEGTS
jgi:hypothetical protein